MSYTCPICKLNWRKNQESIQCSNCNNWIHHNNKSKCSLLSDIDFKLHIGVDDIPWNCAICDAELLPFATLDDSLFLISSLDKDGDVSHDVNLIPSISTNKFVANCDAITNALNYDYDDDQFQLNINSKYYDINKLNSLKLDKLSSFGLFHVNIASLNLHIDDLKLILSLLNFNFDIIGISEHKINNDYGESTVNIDIPGYQKFIFQRTETTHGGTGFYLKNNINSVVRNDLAFNSCSDFESFFIEIKFLKKKNLIVGCIYRHPTSKISIQDFNQDYIDPLLQKISSENKLCAIMGDFNIDLLKCDTHDMNNAFLNSLASNSFSPYVLQPTRLASKSLIDNIFFNTLEYESYSGNLLIEIADHLIQFMILEGFVKERTVPKLNLFKRDFLNFNEDEFIKTILGYNWDTIINIQSNDPDESLKHFYNGITFFLDEFAPLRKISKREYKLKFKPWISDNILKLINERDKLLKIYLQEKNSVLKELVYADYKKIRNLVTQRKRESKSEYYSSYFEKNFNKSSEIWKGIRSLVNIKSPGSNNINLLDENENLIIDEMEIVNKFSDYFASIGSIIESKIPVSTGDYCDYLKKIECLESFFFEPTSPIEISNIIDSLDMNKSTGPNSIPVYILKIMKEFFSKWLSIIINMSFELSIFPDFLKVAKIIPLHKKDSKLKHTNYRPISLLSVFSKIFEKTIYKRMYGFLTKKNLIYHKQYGFRSNYSTNHALTNLTEFIKSSLDLNKYVCGIFVDLEKAFDTVNHQILIKKLCHYGFRGGFNKLMSSYLENRKQFVSINGFVSKTKSIVCGVPQGSSLGPLLFLIYINDFRFCLDKTDAGHFADDTYIMYSSKNIKTLETVMNYELKSVSKWMNLNKLSLNTDKTQLIMFHSKYKSFVSESLSIKFNGKKLIPVDSVKYLGMFLDKHLSWDFHINQLSKKLSRANGILAKLRHNAPFKTCIQVYYAIFYSHLIYGCSLWGLTSEKNLNSIRILQKKCIRILTFSEFNSHTNQHFINHKLLKVDDIIKVQQLKLVYEFKTNRLPLEVQNLFKLSSAIHTYETSSSSREFLFIPQISTANYGNKSLKYQGPYLWNIISKSIPEINQIKTITHLKYVLKKHFLLSYGLLLN